MERTLNSELHKFGVRNRKEKKNENAEKMVPRFLPRHVVVVIMPATHCTVLWWKNGEGRPTSSSL